MCAMSPAVWTNRSSYSSGSPSWTIQYARNPSPVNLSNQPPERRIPRRTEVTNLSITSANRSKRTDSFMSVVDSRMSAAITNIWIGSPSITASSSSSLRNRCSQSGGACGFSSRATRPRSRRVARSGTIPSAPSRLRWRGGRSPVYPEPLPSPPNAGRATTPGGLGLASIHTLGEQVMADHRGAVEAVDEPIDRVVGPHAEEVRGDVVHDAVDRREPLRCRRTVSPSRDRSPSPSPRRNIAIARSRSGTSGPNASMRGGEPAREVREVLDQLVRGTSGRPRSSPRTRPPSRRRACRCARTGSSSRPPSRGSTR